MTIPKKKRRTIVIDGVTYEYCISGFIDIYIKNLTTREEHSWWQEMKEKWKTPFKPSDVEHLIRQGEIFGTKWRKL